MKRMGSIEKHLWAAGGLTSVWLSLVGYWYFSFGIFFAGVGWLFGAGYLWIAFSLAQQSKRLRLIMPVLVLCAMSLGLLTLLVVSAERFYWSNAESYPGWLTSALPQGVNTLHELREQCGKLVEVDRKESGLYARCGLLRYEGPVWRLSEQMTNDWEQLFQGASYE